VLLIQRLHEFHSLLLVKVRLFERKHRNRFLQSGRCIESTYPAIRFDEC
jgi:hypothetical protein